MSSSPSVSVLAVVAIVCLMCQCCFSAPHPCCPGSQKVVSLMSNYVGTFANSISKSSLCSDAQNVADALKGQLIGCSASSHASNNSEWQTLSGQFGQKVTEIDSKCAEFGISIGKVPINGPKGVHVQNVPNSESVISMPGLAGSHTQ
uniref:Putative gland protein G24A12 n=1 Tax=Heterodera glycines TaxID=51029 RepID=Q86DE9_HETGL|nr:putative gland protein G24A12 [Heterodera glycines]